MKTAAALLLFLLTALPVHAANDIQACDKKNYDVPALCIDNAPPVSLKCQAMTRCMLAPKCAALNNPSYKQMYNQALFGLPTMGPYEARLVLISHVLTNFYHQKPKQFTIKVVDQPNIPLGKYQEMPAGQKPLLTVAEESFWFSPAFLVSVLGHEMIHRYQSLVKLDGVDTTGLDYAMTSFRELEASTWECGDTSYPWPIGPNKVAGCLMPAETTEAMNILSCREWQTRNAIKRLRDLPLGYGDRRLKQLEEFLWKNPWTASYWLPQHPDWKNIQADAKPDYCGNFADA